MTELTQADLDKLLNQPIYSWDTSIMLSGVVDFLEFSEENLLWQREREIKRAREEGERAEFEPHDEYLADQYRSQLIDSAEYRFDVGLSQSVRYGGLMAFVISVEKCAKAFKSVIEISIPKKAGGENDNVHLLALLNTISMSGFDEHIKDLRRLVHVRNCIVHEAGFVEKDEHEKTVRDDVELLSGFSISNENFLGTSIQIDRGAVECYAKSAKGWVPKLHENCVNQGLLRGWH